MSFVLWLRELECVKFPVTPAVLMAIFSGRLGSRKLTVMHFKESSEMETLEDGSTNANYSSDFSATAALPTASIRCTTYEDILDAIHGLSALGQEVWYDHMRKLTSRLRAFVAKNKSADPTNTPARVRLTLLYVNKFVGTALGHMQADSQANGRRRSIGFPQHQHPQQECLPLRWADRGGERTGDRAIRAVWMDWLPRFFTRSSAAPYLTFTAITPTPRTRMASSIITGWTTTSMSRWTLGPRVTTPTGRFGSLWLPC
ncbi:hypothetical protein PHYSODRAFT_524670 [Phytophthora sojae]|uniref:Uncharacterized protein n=1 Tax=Phytophthora sojae (strain P6497) TaxID=1094619 RepID=G5A6F6_PHYSP|nr:hypothetical protein PHYSODRAFT_524670 [Phytophthora sojae]EGZ08911.1 hypothetical protein PHYSODRAFT_524670 [Phytophthora sojae]|eukprot:XP_009535544.1 hypothetical protein PHYSODRAFT_524670 [Phytophthora sojae]